MIYGFVRLLVLQSSHCLWPPCQTMRYKSKDLIVHLNLQPTVHSTLGITGVYSHVLFKDIK